MNKRLIGLLAGAALLAACGSDNNAPTASSVCQNFANTLPTVTAKLAQCSVVAGALVPYQALATNSQACTTVVGRCTSDDFGKINTLLTCLKNQPDCTSANLATWGADCLPQIANLSQQCQAAIQNPTAT